jgi:hypothetical protein
MPGLKVVRRRAICIGGEKVRQKSYMQRPGTPPEQSGAERLGELRAGAGRARG